MKNRWLLNLILLLAVAGLVAFLYLKPKAEVVDEKAYELSSFKLSEFSQVRVNFPTRTPLSFKKVDGFWRMLSPFKARADRTSVLRMISIVAAKTETKITPANGEQFTTEELEKFGLTKPSIRLHLLRDDDSQEEVLFGTFNPITDEQYVAHKQAVYLLPIQYSEVVSTQDIELVDKSPLKPQEKIASFDFSHLEQWQDAGLKLKRDDGAKWALSVKEATDTHESLDEWVQFSWVQAAAQSVKFYKPDRQQYPFLMVYMEDGSKVRFDKLQESPQLLLGRPDEGIIYTFPADEGFTMLNPPFTIPSE